MATHRKSVRYGAVAAAAAILLVFGLWPNRAGKSGASDKWWLAPPAAVAETIAQSARAIRTRAVTCRERLIRLGADGQQVGCLTAQFYTSHNSYRRDYYDGDTHRVQETQWYTPEGRGMRFTYVDFAARTYRVLHSQGSYGNYDPVERMCLLVNMRDEAEKLLGTKQIEGREAVGFQIRASQLGNNAPENRTRVWFDTQTRLTVLTEDEYHEPDGRVRLRVQDQIEWNPNLTDQAFVPQIPEGFADATTPQERQEETNTAFDPNWWQQPASQWKDTIVPRLNQVKQAGWRRQELEVDANGQPIPSSSCDKLRLLSGAPLTDYRVDHFDGGVLAQIDWHVQQGPAEVITCVQMDRHCYWTRDASSNERRASPLNWLRMLVKLIDRADRTLPLTTIDGHECIGFEMRATAYGTNPPSWIDRLWFDTTSALPVRVEHQRDFEHRRCLSVEDQFDFTTEPPEDFFRPQIPADCTRVDPPK